uniref:Uncharacterized protein n=1 Tax=Octopus bimaculoides TaxID=37653 RepID=A0A0L8FWA4_OCTBM
MLHNPIQHQRKIHLYVIIQERIHQGGLLFLFQSGRSRIKANHCQLIKHSLVMQCLFT